VGAAQLLEAMTTAQDAAEAGDIGRYLQETPFLFYLMLDGLNEVRADYRKQIVNAIRILSLEYPRHAMVVTSRVQDECWRELREGSLNAETVVVQPITEPQAQAYLAAHLEPEDAQELWNRLDTRMRGLAATPLLLWMLKEAWLESRGRIPGNRGELYANFITRMLRLDDNKMLNTAISRERRLEALESLAAPCRRPDPRLDTQAGSGGYSRGE